MIAALFVQRGGAYWDLPGVDPWDKKRDARLYRGPWPVVAHPPCVTWSKYAKQGKTTRSIGDDEGCFRAAVEAVSTWGGVIEHPAHSAAWRAFGLPIPMPSRWTADMWRSGLSCEVEQGHYGHPTRKSTWLFYKGKNPPPDLKWGPSDAPADAFDCLSHRQRAATPAAFRDLLISIAEGSQ